MIFSKLSKKFLTNQKRALYFSKVYFIKLISFYSVLQITKQFSFYTILSQHFIPGAGGNRSWLKY
jgi:hypothetical protein